MPRRAKSNRVFETVEEAEANVPAAEEGKKDKTLYVVQLPGDRPRYVYEGSNAAACYAVVVHTGGTSRSARSVRTENPDLALETILSTSKDKQGAYFLKMLESLGGDDAAKEAVVKYLVSIGVQLPDKSDEQKEEQEEAVPVRQTKSGKKRQLAKT